MKFVNLINTKKKNGLQYLYGAFVFSTGACDVFIALLLSHTAVNNNANCASLTAPPTTA